MKKIITALANKNLNEALLKEKEYQVIIPDIQYQEGVIEALEKYKEIDVLILSELLYGEKTFFEFINNIKKINYNLQIIIILDKPNDEIKNFLISKGIFKIFYNNEITIEEIINKIKLDNNKINSEEINEEIIKLKNIILEQNNKINKNKVILNTKNKLILNIKKKINKNKLIINIKNKFQIKNKKTKNKIINVCGLSGIGKSIFCAIISKTINNKKILLIDLNELNSITTIFGIKKTGEIIQVNSNIHILCNKEKFIKDKQIEKEKFNSFINESKKKYDLIFIETPQNFTNESIKTITEKSDEIIFLIGANISELDKVQRVLEVYIHQCNIKKNKIKIIFNKYNCCNIDEDILKNIFWKFNILGKIKLNKKYDLIINQNIKIIYKDIKKDFKKTIKKIIK